jgi:hypothetical protein
MEKHRHSPDISAVIGAFVIIPMFRVSYCDLIRADAIIQYVPSTRCSKSRISEPTALGGARHGRAGSPSQPF